MANNSVDNTVDTDISALFRLHDIEFIVTRSLALRDPFALHGFAFLQFPFLD